MSRTLIILTLGKASAEGTLKKIRCRLPLPIRLNVTAGAFFRINRSFQIRFHELCNCLPMPRVGAVAFANPAGIPT